MASPELYRHSDNAVKKFRSWVKINMKDVNHFKSFCEHPGTAKDLIRFSWITEDQSLYSTLVHRH